MPFYFSLILELLLILRSHSLLSKLARLRAQLLEPAPGAGSSGGTGFDVSKSGDARIALVGFPSVGKSTFLSKITKTKSEVAAYSFTTLTAIPGVLEYGGAEIQVLDLPGIIEGAAEGKGRGRQVISAAKVNFFIRHVGMIRYTLKGRKSRSKGEEGSLSRA